MPRKKKEQIRPPAPVRLIHCAFCQKELNPLTDEVRFIGVGKWRDDHGYFHAVCAARTPEGDDNPCFLSGMAWATKLVGQQSICLSYDEWKGRPVCRRISATRRENSRYELNLTETHLNCVYFVETKNAANPEKAKEVVRLWQVDWCIPPQDVPDIDQFESEAHQAGEIHRLQTLRLSDDQTAATTVDFPDELLRELHRHSDKHLKHLVANPISGGDNCKSCRISRGMKKLYAISQWFPVIQESLETMRIVKQSSIPLSSLMSKGQELFDDALKLLMDALDFKPNDEKHNELARKRNSDEIKLAKALVEKYGVKT